MISKFSGHDFSLALLGDETTKSMKTQKQARLPVRVLIMTTLGVLVILFLVLPSFYSSTFIVGEEFCPQLFQTREFRYQRFPGTSIRISQTALSIGRSPCSKPVLTNLAIGPTTWQVAKVQHGLSSQSLGPQILIDQLRSTNADGANFWDAWSFKNPQKASVLWPVVQGAALQELYFCVPDLLRAATEEMENESLRKRLTQICLQAAKLKLQNLLQMQNVNAESDLRNWALRLCKDFSDDPDFTELTVEFSKS